MSNKNKLDLLQSLKIGDVVITGNHIGAIRYLGSLEGNASYNTLHNKNDIYSLYAGIELTEPNGHMNGTMNINGTTITYFKTAYGDNMNRKKRRIDGMIDYGKYGLLIPAVSIQKKIDSFALLKKITLLFEKYKHMKQRLNVRQSAPQQLQSLNSHNTMSTGNNDIKTNSDLISNTPPPPMDILQGLMPISQGTIKLTNSNKPKKWSRTPMPISRRNPPNASTTENGRIALRKIHSFPFQNSDLPEDEDMNSSDLPSMTPVDSNKKPLHSSLPRPMPRVRLNRGYSYNMQRVNKSKAADVPERQRTCSYHVIQRHRINHNPNNKMITTATTSKPSKHTANHEEKTVSKSIASTSRRGTVSGPGHHPSSSMYTHGPLNCWTDSNRFLSNQLTSSGGALDKNKDLSSLAIHVRVGGHVSTRSASYESPHQQHDSQQLKELLEELKRNKLNHILSSRNKQNKEKEKKEEEEVSKDESSSSIDLPVLNDNHTTAATVHSPTGDVLENCCIAMASPEEKRNKKRQSLTKQWLRKHNKRPSKIIFGASNEHCHQQTLSEPMLPKFNLMLHMNSSRSDEDEKSRSSDGDSSLGMDNNLDPKSDHTMDITEDDVQLSQTEEEDHEHTNKKQFWSIAASPISRRSSVNDIMDQQYKTKHEYLRDITYFNTMHRAQQMLNEKNSSANDLDIIKEETHDSGHKTQLSCDTRCAVHESLEIEPYQPHNVTPPQSALV